MIPKSIWELADKTGRPGTAGAAECIGGFPSMMGSGSQSSSLEVQGSQCQCSEKSGGSCEALCDLPLGVLEAIWPLPAGLSGRRNRGLLLSFICPLGLAQALLLLLHPDAGTSVSRSLPAGRAHIVPRSQHGVCSLSLPIVVTCLCWVT